MAFRSLLYRTESLFYRHGGHVIERDGYVVIDTPGRRGWYWGNYVIFDAPPGPGDLEPWKEIFRREFEGTGANHMILAWDDPTGGEADVGQFVENGFELERAVTLIASTVHPPPRLNTEITVREVTTDDDFQQVTELFIDTRNLRFPREPYVGFARKQTETYREMIAAGHGNWYGAFIGDRLAGSLGLFFDGSVGRFQTVCTTPELQRRGICGTLVHEVSTRAFESGRADRLVMVADEEYHAARIYESVGFMPTEHTAAVVYYPEPPV